MMQILLGAILLAAPQDDERSKRILERIEKEIRASQDRLREEIRAILRAELGKAPAPAPAPAGKKPYLGVTADDFTDAERKAAGIAGGLKVAAVRGPAQAAGIQPGDILVELAGEPVSEERIGDLLAKHRPGDTITVVVLRGKIRETLRLTLTERKEQ
jgi:S1-C subfamily serine protease